MVPECADYIKRADRVKEKKALCVVYNGKRFAEVPEWYA